MTDDNHEHEIDWNAHRIASVNVAEMVWTYYQSLMAAGFDDEQSMMLSSDYQHHLLCHAEHG